MGWWRRALVTTAMAVIASGCIGATDRADFDAEVRARGGGVTTTWIDESLEAVAASVGVASANDLEVITLTINAPDRTITAQARRGDQLDFVDVVVVRQGEVVASTPVQDADQLPLDLLLIPLADVPLGDIEAWSDTALTEFGEADGFVQSIAMTTRDSAPLITLSLSSSRRTAQATFDATGTLIEVTR